MNLKNKIHPVTNSILLALFLVGSASPGRAESETSAQREARMAWWREAKFGMFIHWGPCSIEAREISWTRTAPKPLQFDAPPGAAVDPDYDNLYRRFNPTQYDPKQWVAIAKAAGMKYIVLTTKHHDGFSLWPTKARDYNIAATPYKDGQGDIVKEFADACHAAGMRLGFYYSPRDWTHPDYGQGDNARYEAFMKTQVTELLTQYGKVDVIWWDGFGRGDPIKYWHADQFIGLSRQLQPDILNNDRCAVDTALGTPGVEGDFSTVEQTVGDFNNQRPWESCMTISAHNHWSWGGDQDGVKSLQTCIRMLVNSAGGDGNLLLNVGPQPTGEIAPEQVARLKEIGQWLERNGESIYGTRGGPYQPGRNVASTRKGNNVYVHIMQWAGDAVQLPALGRKVLKSQTLTGTAVDVKQDAHFLTINIPAAQRQPLDTIVKLELDGSAADLAPIPLKPAAAKAKPRKQSGPPPIEHPETKAQRDARMQWWREAKFGLFIHWGVFSVPAGYYHDHPVHGSVCDFSEWIMHSAKIPMAEYQQFAKDFNPVKFNADDWVKVARDAGMKYIVITAKHHDGFANFATQASPFNIVDATPFKRDPLTELAAACRKYGLKLGFYYSQAQDWNNGGSVWGNYDGITLAPGRKWDAAQERSMDEYIDMVALPQVRELLMNYGPDIPAVIWWDTAFDINHERGQKFYDLIKSLKPDIIMNNRLGADFKGDTETPEGTIPNQGYPDRDWETCMTMNDRWGFKKNDHNWKSTETLIRNLCDIASKGGNYLLNVGPTSEGLIPQPSLDRLVAVGQWMKINGEAIYDTSATPFGAEALKLSATEKDKNGKPKFIASWDWRSTTKPGKIYLLMFKWPASQKFELAGLQSKVNKAYLLADRKDLKVDQTAAGVTVLLPTAAPDKVASVVCLEIADSVAKVKKLN